MKETTKKNTGIEKELRDIFDDVQYIIFVLDDVNKQSDIADTDMPGLESEESAAQRRKHKGQGLKILTPQQMLSRLFSSIKSRK